VLYLLSADAARADRAESLLADGGTVSVQVLNEFASVALHKLEMPVAELREILGPLRSVCQVEPVTEDTHDRALALVKRDGFSIFDALLVAAALRAG
jgi:predicted nucleic acid-binding protein